MIFIGAEEIISPLGGNMESNWNALLANRSGISAVPLAGFDKGTLHLARIPGLIVCNKFKILILTILKNLAGRLSENVLTSESTLVIISSTKGALDQFLTDPFTDTTHFIQNAFKLKNRPVVVSNACISGVMAINTAGHLVRAGKFEHVVVVGCDVLSDFIVYGFQSLFAISDQPCRPFDERRNGITLGEGCGAVVVSGRSDIFFEKPLQLLPGAGANDANHISGPSRTGEGLVRSVQKTLEMHETAADEISFISAHGTATIYNDEMESIAFDRLGMAHIPVNSMKGYYGHTLGAAGVIETCTSMKCLRESTLIKCQGFEESGTSRKLNVVKENSKLLISSILKTASGFGGGNASLIIRQS